MSIPAPSPYDELKDHLRASPRTWLITGVAGFIGSNLLEALLNLNQHVVGIDNFLTGHARNLEDVCSLVTEDAWSRFRFYQGDIRNLDDCNRVMQNVDYVLHQAALGSVPRSVEDPIATNGNNISGFLNVLVAAKDAGVKNFVYAASSSTYGDHPGLPKVEDKIGAPLSPYAVTKLVNELYASVFSRTYGINTVGLRYFNVFGRRQDPLGAYAAVIPKWINALISGEVIHINGDGETSRDFCFIENVVQANLLAATSTRQDALNQVYNVAVGDRTTLNELHHYLQESLKSRLALGNTLSPIYGDFRAGDVRHSLANIDKARNLLGYTPGFKVRDGLDMTIDWYIASRSQK